MLVTLQILKPSETSKELMGQEEREKKIHSISENSQKDNSEISYWVDLIRSEQILTNPSALASKEYLVTGKEFFKTTIF